MNPLYPAVASRARYRCEYCHAPGAIFNILHEVEHIVPSSRGGTDELSNLALACRACNLFKGARLRANDREGKFDTEIFNPREDDWDSHFEVLPSGEISGRTELGQAMVVLLRMNGPQPITARLLWMKLGLFP